MRNSDGQVTLTIEGVPVTVPEGTMIVDAAKRAGVYIPVFCYHPKLEPVGMCRMCLVEIGRPRRDRASGDFLRDERGELIIEFGPKLETACTTPVGENLVVRSTSQEALTGQKLIVEYLLTSHPLDCPICDKGGECPLQELTMDFGAGKSRFLYDDKIDLAKAYPLGNLITLDRERCIQCARCTRYQDELVGEPVIGFEERGRRLQIVSYSDPGFDSYFSGNTTDICPVGALTSNDFRFEARPWELKAAASICPHCPVGCNTVLNTRRQPNANGRGLVQRVMPRQNEAVNEIWLCDKGRFAHHYAGSAERLSAPLIRVDGELQEATWEEALDAAAEGLREAGDKVVGIASGRASNEDLFHFSELLKGISGKVVLYDQMGGGDLVRSHAVPPGSDLGELGAGDAILVVASDLREEAPVWWYRVKRASDRGATLVVANARPTSLDEHADTRVRYLYGALPGRFEDLLGRGTEAGQGLTQAERLVIFYGSDGLTVPAMDGLAAACAGMLDDYGKTGQLHCGMIPIWPRANTQGAVEIGLRPAQSGQAGLLEGAQAAYLMAADPLGDDPALAGAFDALDFLVVQELYLTETARAADVVFPAQAFTERDGSFVSGERRVQRYFPAVPVYGEARPDWHITASLGQLLGVELENRSPALVFKTLAGAVPGFEGLDYSSLSQVENQWPPVGGENLYFGGTAYTNTQGLGFQLELAPNGAEPPSGAHIERASPAEGELLLVPVTALYDQGVTVRMTQLLQPRVAARAVALNPSTAQRLGVTDGDEVGLAWDGQEHRLPVRIDSKVPDGVGLIPRSMGVGLSQPVRARVSSPEGVG